MSIGNVEEIDSLMEMLGNAKQRAIFNRTKMSILEKVMTQEEIDAEVMKQQLRQIIAIKYPQPLAPYGSPFWCVARAMAVYR